jgi:biotin carboxyl carrier protein
MTLANERPMSDVILGEDLFVPERVVCSPAAGVFRPAPPDTITTEGEVVYSGQVVGTITGPRSTIDVVSPFTGFFMGMLAHTGERVRAAQPVLWIRVADR